MIIISNILVLFVSFLHFSFLILEMFLWTKPIGLKIFRQSLQKEKETKVLAMNQGLYNGFLAVGLLYGVFSSHILIGYYFKIFFLVCVIIAGVFGAVTFSKKIIYIQSFPAIIALIFVFIYNF